MTATRFTKSTRKHRVGRARAVYVVEHGYAVVRQTRPDQPEVVMFLGDDDTGRALEVGGIFQFHDKFVPVALEFLAR